jgi:hypothetical protein
VLAVELAPRIGAGASGGDDHAHPPGWLTDEPNAVAAHLGHVRVNHGDGRRHRHRGLERIAALGEDRASSFDGGVVRRGHGTAMMSGSMELDHSDGWLSASLKPRRLSKPSGVGNRPRKAV